MNQLKSIEIQAIKANWLQEKNISLNVLRLDEWHPVVSGNKWFKLQYYLADALAKGFTTIATFGGAYSNHIVATAFACKEKNLHSIGIIRGEEPEHLSHTLLGAKEYDMHLHFRRREQYKNKEFIQKEFKDVYWIPEGGYGNLGVLGAAQIQYQIPNFESYTHIVCATGTGTTMAGLIESALPHQIIIGISALKNNFSIEEEIKVLLSPEAQQKQFIILHDYHFGGYAKHTPALLQYMNTVWQEHHLPTDFVYTAKAFYGLQDIIMNKEIISSCSRVLFIHTGGLQGNLSLPKEVLAF